MPDEHEWDAVERRRQAEQPALGDEGGVAHDDGQALRGSVGHARPVRGHRPAARTLDGRERSRRLNGN
eukprot:1164958-Prymnesium_polylepis.2